MSPCQAQVLKNNLIVLLLPYKVEKALLSDAISSIVGISLQTLAWLSPWPALNCWYSFLQWYFCSFISSQPVFSKVTCFKGLFWIENKLRTEVLRLSVSFPNKMFHLWIFFLYPNFFLLTSLSVSLFHSPSAYLSVYIYTFDPDQELIHSVTSLIQDWSSQSLV